MSARIPNESADVATTPALWERMPAESSRAWNLFVFYRDMGPSRSTEKVARKVRKCHGYVQRLCTRNRWIERVRAWEVEQERIERAEMIQARKPRTAFCSMPAPRFMIWASRHSPASTA